MDSDDLSVVAGENRLSLGFVDGAPKLLNPALDDPAIVVSPALDGEPPNVNPTGFPILPAGFPKANALVLGGEALPKELTGLSGEGRKMLAGVAEDVAVALPKRVVGTLKLSLLSGLEGDGDGLNIDLLDSVVLLLPNTELPNTDAGLDAASEVPNGLVDLVVAKKFGTLPEPRVGAVGVGRADELADEPSFSWLEEPATGVDVVFAMLEGAANEKPEVGGRVDVEVDVFEAGNANADFGGSEVVADEDVDGSLGLDVRPKGNCVGAEAEGGTKGGNVKPPIFVPPSPAGGSLGDTSTDPADGFGMENNEVVFSGGALAPKVGAGLVVTGPRVEDDCEPSNSD